MGPPRVCSSCHPFALRRRHTVSTRSEQLQRVVHAAFKVKAESVHWVSFADQASHCCAGQHSQVGVDTAERQAYLGHEPAKPGHGCAVYVGLHLRSGPTPLVRGGMAKSSKHEDLKNVSGVQITRGQAQILDLAARDLGVKQIAKQLGVSVPTVKTQLQRFYRANGLHSRAGAVALWVDTQRRRH